MRRYQQARDIYRQFVADHGISMGGAHGWQRSIQETCRSREGRAAFRAYLEQKRLALAAPAKLHVLENLLIRHRRDRVLIFTYDNATVYQIARRFLVPAITHQPRPRNAAKSSTPLPLADYPTVVTNRVLNEGVDIPAANVGVILSGTGTVREHVHARPLSATRRQAGALYEVVTRGTAEEFTSERRRQHHAYR